MKKRLSVKQVYFFLGTTAELIKILPVIVLLKKQKISFKIISSGQNVLNTKELESVFGRINIDIAFEHKRGSRRISTKNFFLWAIYTFFKATIGLRTEFSNKERKSTYLVVHGDTVSSVLGAVIGKLYRLKVVHIESGLRSYDFLEPFPEEICRHIVSRISDVHFCPNSWAVKNLSKIKGLKINTQKNIVIESLYQAIKVTPKNSMPSIIKKEKYFMLMMHRQEHMLFHKDENRLIFETVLKSIPKNMKCLIIMHSLTKEFLKNQKMDKDIKRNKKIIIIPRQPYPIFSRIMNECEFMVTDGGSTQEEAFYLGKPCLIIRNKTERIEGLNSNALLAKGNIDTINKFMNNYTKYRRNAVRLSSKPSEFVLQYFLAT